MVRKKSDCRFIGDKSLSEVFATYDALNADESHKLSSDDICTPMACVKTMIDYLPEEIWRRDDLKILDPCAGNGNFGAYCKFKTDLNNIWFNDINQKRIANLNALLAPAHVMTRDALDLTSFNQWDVVMANPPYSGGGNKNRSLSNMFIEHSISLLKENGYLCFVTPNNWMTYNNDNSTLKKLLRLGSFIVIDNDVKKYFPKVGSSFTIFVWQKGKKTNRTTVKNNYLVRDTQCDVVIPEDLPFLPLYLSNNIIGVLQKTIGYETNRFSYRCDLHNHTKAKLLTDIEDHLHPYKTIHTVRKTRYASIKQDIYDKYLVLVPLSTYFKPFVEHHVNVTQSIGYIPFEDKQQAINCIDEITKPWWKVMIHLTRYGNFNNIMVLKHLKFGKNIVFSQKESNEINKLSQLIKY